MTLQTFFSGRYLDRAVHIRTNPAALEEAWYDSAARLVTVWRSRCLISNNQAVLLQPASLGASVRLADSIYLGQLNGQHLFAAMLDDDPGGSGLDTEAFASFRSLMSTLPPADAALLAYAKSMVEWQQRHRFCGICGSANHSESGGFAMLCSNNRCEQRSFPRIDPAIIVLVTDGDYCLLGRQAEWPEGRFSTIAGFVEPGEALEDAVAREVREETNIEIHTPRYCGSQPWPFPGSIMIGFRATGIQSDILLNDGELAEARWFSRDELTAMPVALPPITSIAFRLIEQWFDERIGPGLQSFSLSSDFSRQRDAG